MVNKTRGGMLRESPHMHRRRRGGLWPLLVAAGLSASCGYLFRAHGAVNSGRAGTARSGRPPAAAPSLPTRPIPRISEMTNAVAINARGDILVWILKHPRIKAPLVLLTSSGIRVIRAPGFFLNGKALNNADQVVGSAVRTRPKSELLGTRAFALSGGRFRLLRQPPGQDWSEATAINDRGDVVGDCLFPTRLSDNFPAVLWTNGHVKRLPSLYGLLDVAYGINDHREIVGSCTNSNGRPTPVFWDRKGVHALRTLGGGSGEAEAVNDSGRIVGYSTIATGQTHACLWESGRVVDLLGNRSRYSEAAAISPDGTVAGFFLDGKHFRAFTWSKGRVSLLPRPDDSSAKAEGVNDAGDVVGDVRIKTPQVVTIYAVVWRKGQMRRIRLEGLSNVGEKR